MQFRYPRSFFKLLAVGFLLAVLPLISGLIANTVTIQHLSVQSQQAAFDAARIAHGSRQLAEITPALERAARQNLILDDNALREGYAALRNEFSAVIQQMQSMPVNTELRDLLHEMQALESAIFEQHQARPANAGLIGRQFR